MGQRACHRRTNEPEASPSQVAVCEVKYDRSLPPAIQGGQKKIYLGEFHRNGQIEKCAVACPVRGYEIIDMIVEVGLWHDVCSPGHDNILRLYHFSKADGVIAMELIDPIGFDLVALGTLYSFDGGKVMPVAETADIFRKLIGAIRYLHEEKAILHRDLKADQVLITPQQNVKLTDFGLAIRMSTLEKDVNSRRMHRSRRGNHLAPEIPSMDAARPAMYDGKVDVYGLGWILTQLYFTLWPRKGQLISSSVFQTECDGNKAAWRELEDIVNTGQALMNPSPKERITLTELENQRWMQAGRGGHGDHADIPLQSSTQGSGRRYLRRFGKRLVAISAKLESPFPRQGMLLKDVASGDWTCLLIGHQDGTYETFPRADSRLSRGQRIFFGCKENATVEASCASEAEADALRSALDGEGQLTKDIKIGETVLLQGCELRDQLAHDIVVGTTLTFDSDPKLLLSHRLKLLFTDELVRSENNKALIPFSLEFDAFKFPKELVSPCAILGPKQFKTDENQVALDFRSKYEINLAGIARPNAGRLDVEWMPGPRSLVVPGSFGLVVRKPTKAGVSLPTITDEELEAKGLIDLSMCATLS